MTAFARPLKKQKITVRIWLRIIQLYNSLYLSLIIVGY